NNLTLYRPTNTVSDAVSGVTFNLKGAGTTAVAVTANTEEINLKVRFFIDAYNAVQDFIAAQYKPDGKGRPAGPLVGDSTLRAVQNGLRDVLAADSAANGGALTNLAQLGIGRDDAGKLKLDPAALNDKLKTSLGDVKALLAGSDAGRTGVANAVHDAYARLSDTVTGTVQTAIKGYTTSVANLEKTIAAQMERLDAMRASLTRRFTAVDAAIGQLNGQGNTLAGVLKSMQPREQR
ncbi:MAG: flagellar filament capping protein FliD, partial [Pyrinomonadaceae bacterium]